MATEYASESGHWYTRDGKPMYTIIGKNRKERPTTLRDARQLGLVPSVTTIIKLAAAPALENWKAEQVLMAALTLPRIDGEAEKAWVQRVHADSREQGAIAATRGTEIHGAIEKMLKGEEPHPLDKPYAQAALDLLNATYPGVTWESEKSFAHQAGFGGKVDLHAKIGIVVDFKGKDGDKVASAKCYDEHYMQLAAYSHGLGMPEAICANIFFARNKPEGAIHIPHDTEATTRGWRQFLALLDFFKAKTGLME